MYNKSKNGALRTDQPRTAGGPARMRFRHPRVCVVWWREKGEDHNKGAEELCLAVGRVGLKPQDPCRTTTAAACADPISSSVGCGWQGRSPCHIGNQGETQAKLRSRDAGQRTGCQTTLVECRAPFAPPGSRGPCGSASALYQRTPVRSGRTWSPEPDPRFGQEAQKRKRYVMAKRIYINDPSFLRGRGFGREGSSPLRKPARAPSATTAALASLIYLAPTAALTSFTALSVPVGMPSW